MQILIIIWEPNAEWHALGDEAQKGYLSSLDAAVTAVRSQGVMTLGWSKIDRTLPKAPTEGYVGVFAMSNTEQCHELEKNVQAAGWYDYFDSVNVSINPEGGTSPLPSQEYARLLEIELG